MMVIKIMVDNLALINHPFFDDENVLHVLLGLGLEYKEINITIGA